MIKNINIQEIIEKNSAKIVDTLIDSYNNFSEENKVKVMCNFIKWTAIYSCIYYCAPLIADCIKYNKVKV